MRAIVVAVVAAAMLGFPSSSALSVVPPPDEPPNPDKDVLMVYVNNIENLMEPDSPIGQGGSASQCRGEWTDLIYHMTRYGPPDLFLVQQVDANQVDELVTTMNTLLLSTSVPVSDRYKAVKAENNPEETQEPCPAKSGQTNAIIYLAKRLSLVTNFSWQVRADMNGDGACPANELNESDRTRAVFAKFTDRLTTGSGRTVAAVSIHWPKGDKGRPCADENAIFTSDQLKTSSSSLQIWGGDANVSDLDTSNSWRSWYQNTVNGDLSGSLKFRDAIYDHCKGSTDGSQTQIKNCAQSQNWTASGPDERYDFLFGRIGSSTKPFVNYENTVTFNEADEDAALYLDPPDEQHYGLDYSLHRAVRARIHYCTTDSC